MLTSTTTAHKKKAGFFSLYKEKLHSLEKQEKKVMQKTYRRLGTSPSKSKTQTKKNWKFSSESSDCIRPSLQKPYMQKKFVGYFINTYKELLQFYQCDPQNFLSDFLQKLKENPKTFSEKLLQKPHQEVFLLVYKGCYLNKKLFPPLEKNFALHSQKICLNCLTRETFAFVFSEDLAKDLQEEAKKHKWDKLTMKNFSSWLLKQKKEDMKKFFQAHHP